MELASFILQASRQQMERPIMLRQDKDNQVLSARFPGASSPSRAFSRCLSTLSFLPPVTTGP